MYYVLTEKKHQLSKLCGFVLRVLFSEPVPWMPSKWDYQKVLAGIWVGAMFILAQGYSGTLVSMLAAPSFHIPINR